MLLLEEDLTLFQPAFFDFVRRACSVYEREHSGLPTIMQLSRYAEALLLSLEGARRLVSLVREHGIVKNDDQQLLDPRSMGGAFRVRRFHGARGGRNARGGGSASAHPPPWSLARPTNNGIIHRSRRLTWAELALLRLLTRSPRAADPSFGNPRDTDFHEAGW